MYLIGIEVYLPHDKQKLEEHFVKDYQEEVERRRDKKGEWYEYSSLEEYGKKGRGDVLFFFTPKSAHLLRPKRELCSYVLEQWKKIG